MLFRRSRLWGDVWAGLCYHVDNVSLFGSRKNLKPEPFLKKNNAANKMGIYKELGF